MAPVSRHAVRAVRITILFSVFLCGCNTVPEVGSLSHSTQASLSMAPTAPPASGYVHLIANSKFRVGDSMHEIMEYGLDKIVGSEGVFATVPSTGWAFGAPNADAPASVASPFVGTPDSHNQMVLQYFVAAGLPAEQVERVDANGRMMGQGKSGSPLAYTGQGYDSILTRVVSGMSVPDSFAWARFNNDGVVVAEGVYWPPIPSSVIADGQALVAIVNDPLQKQALLAKLPVSTTDGTVVIRHSPPTPTTSFEVFASFDVRVPGSALQRHFSSAGSELTLASEQAVDVAASRQSP